MLSSEKLRPFIFINKSVMPIVILILLAFTNTPYFYIKDMVPKRKTASIPEVGEPSGLQVRRDGSSLTEREDPDSLFDCGMY